MTIWKFPLQVTDVQHIQVPGHVETLCVQLQGDKPVVWVSCIPGQPNKLRTIRIYGTGQSGVMGIYIGTFQEGPFVWHVFEDR